jgi:ATP-binding cassette, subfamily B, bacterial
LILLSRFIQSITQRFDNLRRAGVFVWQSAPNWTAASAGLLIVEGLLPVVSLYLLKLMLDTVEQVLQLGATGQAIRNMTLVIAAAGGVMLITNIAHTVSGVVSQAHGRAVVDYMYDVLHSKSLAIDLEYYENAQYYDALHRAQEDATYRPVIIVEALTALLRSSVSLVGVMGLLLAFNWVVAPILLVAVLPGILVRLRYSHVMFEAQRQYTGAERRAWYFHWMMTSVEYAKEIRVFGLGELLSREYRQVREKLRRLRLKLDLSRAGWELGAQGIATVAVFGSYFYIAYRTVLGAATLGDLALFYQAFQRGQGFLQDLLDGAATLYESNLFLTNVYDFLDLEQKVVEPESPQPLPKPMQTGVMFDHVHFTYPTGSQEVLRDVSLKIRPAEVIALVGENGSGKTTLVKLLCRLYEPTQGKIALDGIDLRRFHTRDLRSQLGVIFQDFAHYNLTARENIWFGNVAQPPDETRISAAARQAGVHDLIVNLKAGYDTILGALFEDGEELSIGEWQKIALARAFLRETQIIVLDEPTSAMDARAEYELFQRFRQLLNGRSAIVISHRLSTVRMADRIYVLQEGQIVESGSHDQLVAQDGIYARLYHTQAQPYLS